MYCHWKHCNETHWVGPFKFCVYGETVLELAHVPSSPHRLQMWRSEELKMTVFWCPQVEWQFQSPISFPAVKEELILIYFTKKWRAETLQPGLEFDNYKPRLKIGIFKCISWLNVSFFGGDDRGILLEEFELWLHPVLKLTNGWRYTSIVMLLLGEKATKELCVEGMMWMVRCAL